MSDETTKAVVKTPVDKLKTVISSQSVQEQFRNALQDSAPLFVASLIDIYTGDKKLQQCSPGAVIMEALKAATLKLPINRNLGFAYIISHKGVPGFQLGYRGYLQLAARSGQYKYINADVVYEGELKSHDKMTGELDLSGEATSDKVAGYFAYMETISGFRKAIFWPIERVRAHAKKFSPTYSIPTSPWHTNFDAMALKTMLRNLLGKYGIMSVELVQAISHDSDGEQQAYESSQMDVENLGNAEVIDIKQDGEVVDADLGPAKTEAPEAESLNDKPPW